MAYEGDRGHIELASDKSDIMSMRPLYRSRWDLLGVSVLVVRVLALILATAGALTSDVVMLLFAIFMMMSAAAAEKS